MSIPFPYRPDRTRWARLVLTGVVLLALACGGGGTEPGADRKCEATARYPDAVGCAYIYGRVTDARGVAMDSVDGTVRSATNCACSLPRIETDNNGAYSVFVHQLPGPQGFSQTSTVTVVVLASGSKYPRHLTGAAYFDTLRLVVPFAPNGASPTPVEVNLQIRLPEP